jgi:hypothetical protein
MALKSIPMSHQVMFSDLAARALDGEFDALFSTEGNFQKSISKGRAYWYYVTPMVEGHRSRKMLGPADDPAVEERVRRFKELKHDAGERRQIVRSLIVAGLPEPNRLVGDVIEKLAAAGLFRLRVVLIGSVAYQAYCGYLGVNMPNRLLMTNDVDFGQFFSISNEIDDEMPSMLETLQSIDPTFAPIMHLADASRSTKYRNSARTEIEFLTPSNSSQDYQGKPAKMAALGGASAEPMRFLDFLIHDPIRSVLLHRAGIAVTIPAPARYAIHKLIVAVERQQQGGEKSLKDIDQAASLIEAMKVSRRQDDLGLAWIEAWNRGPSWREALRRGSLRLPDESKTLLAAAIAAGCQASNVSKDDFIPMDIFPEKA